MTSPADKDLQSLAQACGIQTSYWDLWGQCQQVDPATLAALLRLLGLDPDAAEKELQGLRQRHLDNLVAPVLLHDHGALPLQFHIHLPMEAGEEGDVPVPAVAVTLQPRDGGGKPIVASPTAVRLQERSRLHTRIYCRWLLEIDVALAPGYYETRVEAAWLGQRHRATTLLLVSPPQAYLPAALSDGNKRVGISIALYGLRSQRNWGIGDFTDLKDFVCWAVDSLGVTLIGINPLHAVANREPYNISPYYPSSRLYRNPVYLDVEAVAEYGECLPAQAKVKAAETQALLAELRAATYVNYQQVAALKLQVLRLLFACFQANHLEANTERGRRFLAFVEREGEPLEMFATYCALEQEMLERTPPLYHWRQWPLEYRNPRGAAVQEFRRRQRQEVLFHQYVQWLVESQLQEVQALAVSRGAELGLYLDMALGVDPNGADSWAYADFFVSGVTVGAPPDDFAPSGQDWGFHPPRRERHRQDGYRLFSLELRQNCRQAGALRLDHVMRFFRLFWIPSGQPPAAGAYVEDCPEELLAVVILESHRASTLIIGEDLGTVPPGVRQRLQDAGIFSYRLLLFERDCQGEAAPPEAYPEKSVATISTHDLPTLAGYWRGEDIYWRQRLGLLEAAAVASALERRSEERLRLLRRLVACGLLAEDAAEDLAEGRYTRELKNAVLEFLLSTSAKLVIVSQDDLFEELHQQNLPGTVTEYPNWRRKMRFALEELNLLPEVQEVAAAFRGWIAKWGREGASG